MAPPYRVTPWFRTAKGLLWLSFTTLTFYSLLMLSNAHWFFATAMLVLIGWVLVVVFWLFFLIRWIVRRKRSSEPGVPKLSLDVWLPIVVVGLVFLISNTGIALRVRFEVSKEGLAQIVRQVEDGSKVSVPTRAGLYEVRHVATKHGGTELHIGSAGLWGGWWGFYYSETVPKDRFDGSEDLTYRRIDVNWYVFSVHHHS